MSYTLPSNIQNLLNESLERAQEMALVIDHPALDRFTRVSAGGLSKKVPIITGFGGGKGGSFASSLAAAKVGVVNDVAFSIEPAAQWGHSIVNWTDARFTGVKENSALDVATKATVAAMYNCTDNFVNVIFATSPGCMSSITAVTSVSGNVYDLTLGAVSDVAKFAQDDVLQTAASPTAGVDAGTMTVIGLQQIAGIIRVLGDGTLVPTATHLVGLQGQLNDNSFPSIFGYVPRFQDRTAGLPNLTTYMGVTRDATAAGVAVYGWAYDLRNKPFFLGINKMAAPMKAYRECAPNLILMNPIDLPQLAQECQAQMRFDMPSKSGIAEVLYQGFEVGLVTGKAEVLGESSVPAGTVVLTRGDAWIIATPDKPFAPASPHGIMVQDFNTNQARFSVEMSGYFFTQKPIATACGQLY